MKKLFTTVLCALAFLSASAQENTFSSNPQPKEIKSANHNTRGGSWRSYDDDQYVTGIGGPQTFAWGIMFPAETLSEGQNITKTALFDVAASTGDVCIYYGGTTKPETLIHKQEYKTTGAGEWVEIELTTPLPLFGENLWVVYTTNEGQGYPAAACANSGDPNGRWITLDNTVWEDVASYNLPYSWMIRAYIEGEGVESIVELGSSFNVYPNPAKNQLFVETEMNVEEISVYDTFGRLMTTVNGQQKTVDVSELNNGVYFVRIKSNNEVITRQFIKE